MEPLLPPCRLWVCRSPLSSPLGSHGWGCGGVEGVLSKLDLPGDHMGRARSMETVMLWDGGGVWESESQGGSLCDSDAAEFLATGESLKEEREQEGELHGRLSSLLC